MVTTLRTASTVLPDEQRLLLSCVPWSDYEKALDLLAGRHIRVTFDRGNLEIMTTSARHEMGKSLLAWLTEVLFEELDIAVIAVGNTTWKRRALERGLEADECWYVQNAPAVRGLADIDLERSPAPDLAIEIEISRSVLDRMGIYAALGVREVWRSDGSTVQFSLLQPNGDYAPSERSIAIPRLQARDFSRFLQMKGNEYDTVIVKAFRNWVRTSLQK